jgi:SAM-dependent methyltransferase
MGQDGEAEKTKRRRLPGLTVAEGYTQHPFDLQHGVRTSGLIPGRHLGNGQGHDRYNTAYYGVAPSVFQGLIVRWRRNRPVAPIDAFTFIDFGAGMGRAVMLAAELPFREVVGVEINPVLARIARGNLAVWRASGRACAPMHIECRDAVEFKFPAGPCVAFLFNPFGAPVMRRLLKRVAETFAGRAGQFDLLYANNEQEAVLKRQPGFTQLYAGQVMRSRADAIADHKILANQPDGEYASANYEDCSLYRWVGLSPETQKKKI